MSDLPAAISIATDPGMPAGTILLRPGACDWGNRIQGRAPHSAAPEWRITAGCEHEHIESAYLCGACAIRARQWLTAGSMHCRKCSAAGERSHCCVDSLVEAVELGGDR